MRVLTGALGVALVLLAAPAGAVRPFITDDARVVGKHQMQVESWVRYDMHSLQHWIVPAVGPIAPLEVTLGAVHGIAIDPDRKYSFAAPLLQAKFLIHPAHPNDIPGLAIIGGTFLPFGFGGFESPPSGFVYAAVTEVLGEDDDILIHANIGFAGAQLQRPAANNPRELEKHERYRSTWGVATQIHLYRAANLAAEVFSGDPYAEVGGGACQGGIRWVLSPNIQLDTSGGGGIYGTPRMPIWGSVGFRMVSGKLW